MQDLEVEDAEISPLKNKKANRKLVRNRVWIGLNIAKYCVTIDVICLCVLQQSKYDGNQVFTAATNSGTVM